MPNPSSVSTVVVVRRPVRTQESERLPGIHLKVDSRDGMNRTVGHPQATNFDNRARHHSYLPCDPLAGQPCPSLTTAPPAETIAGPGSKATVPRSRPPPWRYRTHRNRTTAEHDRRAAAVPPLRALTPKCAVQHGMHGPKVTQPVPHAVVNQPRPTPARPRRHTDPPREPPRFRAAGRRRTPGRSRRRGRPPLRASAALRLSLCGVPPPKRLALSPPTSTGSSTSTPNPRRFHDPRSTPPPGRPQRRSSPVHHQSLLGPLLP